MEKGSLVVLLMLGVVGAYALTGIASTGQAAEPNILDAYYGPYFHKTSPGYEYPAMVAPQDETQWFVTQRSTTPAIEVYYNENTPEDIVLTLPNYPAKNTNWGR